MPRVFKSAGENRQNHHHAQQAQLRADANTKEPTPLPSDPPGVWADYCNRARGEAAGAVIEWGRRIQEAHDAYRAQGQCWGRTWDDWCRENLGISKVHAHRLETIGENLLLDKLHILPAATDQLFALARLHRDAPEVFSEAVDKGLVHPSMTRAETRALAPAKETSARQKPPTKSIRLTTELVDLLEQKAQERGMTLVELLEAVAMG